MTTTDDLVPDTLWQALQPLLPTPPPRYPPHRPATAADHASTTAPAWPASSTSCATGSAGVWQRLHQLLLDHLGRDGRLDWSRASLDSLSVRAKRGAA
jgi:transposase